MLEILTKAIEQLNSSVFILVVMLYVCFWTVYHVGKWTETFLSHSKKIDASEEKHHALFQSLAHIIAKGDLIYNNTLKNPVVMAHSPLQLTEAGTTGSESIGLHRVLTREFDKLSGLVKKSAPRNAYDIQTRSMQIANEQFLLLLNESELNRAKGLQLEDLSSILGLLLRDQILAQKDIPLSAVDEPMPSKLPTRA
jgi:hypothetical protein